MSDFIPPRDNKFISGFAKTLMPMALNQAGLKVTVTENCLWQIAALGRHSTVLMVNHADRYDPVVAMELSRKCKQNFYYLAALEQFEAYGGLWGWFMQGCGAYSVIRGQPVDQVSRNTTVSVIASGARKLIMFPEGDVSGRDDIILPLKKDGLENIFSAQGRLAEANLPVFLLPIGIYYEVPSSSLPLIIGSVANLERKFLLHHGPLASLQTRVETLVRAFINHLECKYGVVQHPELPVATRLLGICRKELIGIAEMLGMEVSDESEAVLLYSVRSKLRRLTTFCNCHYCHQLEGEEKRRAAYLKPELDRMQQFLILASTLQEQPFSLEVAWRILDRLEPEMKSVSWKGERKVRVDAAQPIDLRDFFNEYQKMPNETLAEVEHLVQRGLLECLERSKSTCRNSSFVISSGGG